MVFGKRTANILLAIAVFLFLVWGTRMFVFFGELQAGTLPAPAIHLAMVVINLIIAAYLAYLGIRGRSAGAAGQRVE